MYRLIIILSLLALCYAGNLYEELTAVNASMFKNLVDQAGKAAMLEGSTGKKVNFKISV